MPISRLSLPALIGFFFISTSAGAQALPPPPRIEQDPPIGMNAPDVHPVERIGEGMFRIGLVIVDKKQRSVSFPASVNMTTGLLEYLVVRNGGKTHESLLKTEAEPYDIQLGLLLLGLSGTDRPLAIQGARELPHGDPVQILITQGKAAPFTPDKWLSKLVNEKKVDVPPLQWVFTGSWINYGKFMAQVDGSIVSVYHDPVAIIDNASPGGDSDRIWLPREGSVAPVGSPVTVTIKPLK